MAAEKKKILLPVLFVLTILLAGSAFWVYRMIYLGNVDLGGKRSEFFYIHSDWDYDRVANELVEQKFIKSRSSFDWVAKMKKYKDHVKPGRYRIIEHMSNSALINMLRIGEQEPVHFTFNAVHTKEQLASRVGGKLEADSVSLLRMLNDNTYLSHFGMNSNTVLSLFIPSTYEFYWTTSAEGFMEHMAKEYKKFWTDDRKNKARSIGLSQTQVITLASIVQEEQSRYDDEKPIIAGVYLNRLRENMPLQSDPTVRYALGKFNVSRILSADLKIDSPYNTYLHTGLPPGPISFPDASSVDGVLNYKKHKYIYMCADFSTGRHNFSETFAQHKVFAQRYREALDRNGILR
jgi:UPF0755 protein